MRILKEFNYFKENIESEEDPKLAQTLFSSESDEELAREFEGESDEKNTVVDKTEEEGEYEGTKKLKELASALGTEVVDNSVVYDGKKINFYSETEKFHVDKKKFKTIEEVLEYLNHEPTHSIEEEEEEEEVCCCANCNCDPCECDENCDDDFNSWLEENRDYLEDEYGEYVKNTEMDGNKAESFNKWAETQYNSETHNPDMDREYQGFGLKDDRIKWPREEEDMESRIIKKFKNF